MKDEKQRMLEEFEKELWEDDLLKDMPQSLLNKNDDEELDAILAKILENANEEAGPAFEDPDKLRYSDEPLVYYNYSNDYGKNDPEEGTHVDDEYADDDGEEELEAEKSEDRWIVALMGVASALCLGIIGVLIYWMEAFLG